MKLLPTKLINALSLLLMPATAAAHPTVTGLASYYSMSYIDKTMANGRPYRPEHFTVATWDYPLGTRLRLTYHSRGGSVRTVVVTVTDRGPARHLVEKGRRFDLSWAAFRQLENHKVGVIRVIAEVEE